MGYGYSSTYSTSDGLGFMGLLLLIFLICYLVAWVLTMGIVTQAAREKGYDDLGGKLWFIGLFGFVFTPAIIVAALPDRKLRDAYGKSANDDSSAGFDELPDL